jgi:hypothetical protein
MTHSECPQDTHSSLNPLQDARDLHARRESPAADDPSPF